MKNLRNVLAGLAVIFAVGTAFAIGTYNGPDDHGVENNICKVGTLEQTLPGQCTDFVTDFRCTVKLPSNASVPAFDDIDGTQCIRPLYLQDI